MSPDDPAASLNPDLTAEMIAALASLRYLLGEWEAVSLPGEPKGGFTFKLGALGHVILRTNFAGYPATPERPPFRHEDLMVIYIDEANATRADYYDSEGHVIRYTGQTLGAGEVAFVSESTSLSPVFRLAYRLAGGGTLEGTFEIASPQQPEAFAPYLAWSARKVNPSIMK